MEKPNNSILIVDDEKANILALSHILSPEYTVCVAKNGEEALEVAREHLPTIILLDILMPDIDGYEVLARLKKMEVTKEIPVIFVTGLGNEGDEEKGLRLGASDYITKPFNPAIVRLRVKNHIKLLTEQRSRAKNELMMRMSHEMYTPMNAIIGLTNIIKISDDKEKITTCLEKIDSASHQLLKLIDDMLEVSTRYDSHVQASVLKNDNELKKKFTGKTALLVDDLETNRYVMKNLLKDTQIQIDSAENGLEAVEMFSADPKKYNIILMDISMPVMDGWEAARQIRALAIPEGTQVKIVAVTSFTHKEDIERCFQSGMNDHIGKPINTEELFMKLNKLLV